MILHDATKSFHLSLTLETNILPTEKHTYKYKPDIKLLLYNIFIICLKGFKFVYFLKDIDYLIRGLTQVLQERSEIYRDACPVN